MSQDIQEEKPRKFIRLMVLMSLLLHAIVLIDYGWSPSGTPSYWRYSGPRLALICVYLGFLAVHLILLRKISHRAAKSNLLFAILFASILYAGIEGLIRVHGFGMITPSGRYRAEYWYQGNPNRSWRHIGGRLYTPQLFSTPIDNNSAGWRDWEHACKPVPGVYRILLLGDSFVEAFQLNLRQTLQTILQERLSRLAGLEVEVIAIGKSGMGLNWQMGLLPDLMGCYKPQLVVSDYIASLFVFRDGASSEPPAASTMKTSKKAAPVQWEMKLLTHPITHALIWRNLSNSAGFVLVRLARLLDSRAATQGVAPTVSASMTDVVDKSAQTYARLHGELREKGVSLLVALYPLVQNVAYQRNPKTTPVAGVLERRMEERLRSTGVPVVNLTRWFAAATEIPVDDFHIPGDGHFSPVGHRVGAECLANVIQKTFIPTR